MANKPKPSPRNAPLETSDSIAEQTAAFLKAGGTIEQVERGVSSQVFKNGKQISISPRSSR